MEPRGVAAHEMEKEIWVDDIAVGANPEEMVLVDAVRNLVSPDCGSANEIGTVSFTYQQVFVLKPACLEFLVWHVDGFDLGEVEGVPLNIRDPEIWACVRSRPIAGGLGNSVCHLGDLTQWNNGELAGRDGYTRREVVVRERQRPALRFGSARNRKFWDGFTLLAGKA